MIRMTFSEKLDLAEDILFNGIRGWKGDIHPDNAVEILTELGFSYEIAEEAARTLRNS